VLPRKFEESVRALIRLFAQYTAIGLWGSRGSPARLPGLTTPGPRASSQRLRRASGPFQRAATSALGFDPLDSIFAALNVGL